jgi:hypothetical protein
MLPNQWDQHRATLVFVVHLQVQVLENVDGTKRDNKEKKSKDLHQKN